LTRAPSGVRFLDGSQVANVDGAPPRTVDSRRWRFNRSVVPASLPSQEAFSWQPRTDLTSRSRPLRHFA